MSKKLKIGFFNSIDETIPSPKGIINAPLVFTKNLAEELSKNGHQITLFALKNSRLLGAKIYPLDYQLDKNIKTESTEWVSSIYFNRKFLDYELTKDIRKFYNQLAISEICLKQKEFDILHFNYSVIDNIVPFARLFKKPVLIVLHDCTTPLRKVILKKAGDFKNIYFISISASQRNSFKTASFVKTIHHGIDINEFSFNPKPKNHLLFSGRLLYKKGVDAAIKAAKRSKKNLKIIGTANDLNYYNKSIEPCLNKNIQYLGMKSREQLAKLYQDAQALLFPIRWKEPFGLVMIEAMACGTPVIAFDRGPVREIIKHGKTGFIVKPFDKDGKENIKGFVEAIKKIDQIDRRECRKWVEQKFTFKKTVDEYEKVYYEILANQRKNK